MGVYNSRATDFGSGSVGSAVWDSTALRLRILDLGRRILQSGNLRVSGYWNWICVAFVFVCFCVFVVCVCNSFFMFTEVCVWANLTAIQIQNP